MIDDIVQMLSSLGLSLNQEKVKWMKHVHVLLPNSAGLVLNGVVIPPSSQITCLGSVLTGTLDEKPAFEHRIDRGWVCYHKWAHVLQSNAPLASRLQFWSKTVLPSLLWGLQTTRSQNKASAFHKLLFTQKLMIRKMMKSKRKIVDGVQERWLDYHIRSLRATLDVIDRFGVNVHRKLHDLKTSWAGHISRFGVGPKEPHLLKALLAFRCSAWWYEQKLFNSLNWDVIRHAPQLGVPKRWESQFSSNWWTAFPN